MSENVFFLDSSITISKFKCKTVRNLTALYGAVLGSAILIILFCTASTLVIAKSLSWKEPVYVRTT